MTPEPHRRPPAHSRHRLGSVATGIRLLAVLALLLVTACSPLQDDDEDSNDTEASLLPMTLTSWLLPPDASAPTAEPLGVTHLSITPMQPGDNGIVIHLTDLDGQPLQDTTEVTLDLRPLAPDADTSSFAPDPDPDIPATWAIDTISLPDQGWYALDVSLHSDDGVDAVSTIYALLPDPSVYGAEALDLPTTDAASEELYDRALAAYGGWETGAWRESLGSGTDVLVVTDYAVASTDPATVAMSVHSEYAGSFRARPDGTEPNPPRRDFSSRVVIGETAWTSEEDGIWLELPALKPHGFEERADIYSGATNILPAGSETVDGTETEIITFYLPRKGGQAEAWFAWWIDPDTGNPLRMAMIAKMHFMVWDFHDIDADIKIDPPPASAIATPAV